MKTIKELANSPEPSKEQITQLLNGIRKCLIEGAASEFLRVWIRDWTVHKLAMTAPKLPALTDERIYEIAMSDDVSLIEDQGPGIRPRIIVHNSIGGVYAFARAIERELLGENQ